MGNGAITAKRLAGAGSFGCWRRGVSDRAGQPEPGRLMRPTRLTALAGLMLAAIPASAAVVTADVRFSATDFFEALGSGASLPVDPAFGRVRVTFDDALAYDEARSGLAVTGLNFTAGEPMVFSWAPGEGVLWVGVGCPCGTPGGLFELGANSDDFLLGIAGPADHPQFVTFAYSQAAFPDIAIANAGYAAAVPEPSSWAMLIAGFGLTGALWRQRRRQPA